MTRRAALLACILLAACGPGPLRVAVPPVPPGERIPVGAGAIQLTEVSLPSYATDNQIYVQEGGVALSSAGRVVWADDPARAVTLDLSAALAGVTGARVAPDPWPFVEDPDVLVDVRVAEFAPDLTQGAFVIRGQFFVASEAEGGPNRAREFRVTAPLAPDAGPAGIATARAQATVALARDIAQRGLR